jgi:RNA polymerase sigma-70 factor (ECF subfamily)
MTSLPIDVTSDRSERFAVLWAGTRQAVASYVFSIVRDRHHAEDMLNQIALVMLRRFEEDVHGPYFQKWAIGVARMHILAYRRGLAREKLVFTDEVLDIVGQEFAQMSDELEEYRAALGECFKDLTQRMKQLLELRYYENLMPGEVATKAGVSNAAARMMIRRARILLKECIQKRLKD